MTERARLIAIYLPQFHPIPENDAWWGRGFTEWANVTKARPFFKGHYQPKLPADLGYYDLRVPEVREAQAEMARNAGIEGFCYYHYWFGGHQLLEMPFQEVVRSGKPDFPFCLCWANESWSGMWHGAPDRVLIQQEYPGPDDHLAHFRALESAFHDRRYMQVDGRPIFCVYRPYEFPGVSEFISQWQDLAVGSGLAGIHFVAHLTPEKADWDFHSHGFSSSLVVSTHRVYVISPRTMLVQNRRYVQAADAPYRNSLAGKQIAAGVVSHWLWRRARIQAGKFAGVRLYSHALPYLLDNCITEPDVYPCVTPNWDNTARSGLRGRLLHHSTPELFRIHLKDALRLIEGRRQEQRIIFIKSWNEWAEGNYLEPDQEFGHDYLKVIREEIALVAHSIAERAGHLSCPALSD